MEILKICDPQSLIHSKDEQPPDTVIYSSPVQMYSELLVGVETTCLREYKDAVNSSKPYLEGKAYHFPNDEEAWLSFAGEHRLHRNVLKRHGDAAAFFVTSTVIAGG